MLAYAKKAQKLPRVFGMGIPVSNQTDSQVWEDIMKSYGARLADDKGKRIILGDHKKEVWEFLDYFNEVWKAGVLPPGVATWDNTMNNSTYQSGKAVFILNPITLSLWLEENNPELLAKTGHYTYPKGPKGLIQPVTFGSRVDPEVHEGPGLAKQFLWDSMEPGKMEQRAQRQPVGPGAQGVPRVRRVEEEAVHEGPDRPVGPRRAPGLSRRLQRRVAGAAHQHDDLADAPAARRRQLDA